MPINTMIVDDEPFVRKDLHNMLLVNNALSEENKINVICEAGTIEEAKKLLLENSLDLVFLDIQLRGGTGFDLIPYIDTSVDIIFVSAFDEYALRAFDINAFDYILKPVTSSRLAEALVRISEKKKSSADKEERLTERVPKSGRLNPGDSIMIKSNSTRFFICLHDIIAISSIGGNYASIIMNNGDKLVSRRTMKEWETCLPETAFIRIHRSTIINISFIKHIACENDGTCTVLLVGYEPPFTVSRRMSSRFKSLIKQDTL